MRTWVSGLLFFVFATPINGGVLKVADVHKFWAESGVTKEMVSQVINTSNCFDTDEKLAACRAALTEAKSEIGDSSEATVEDDFNGLIDSIDAGTVGADKGKEWLFGLMLNTYVRSFDAHASVAPESAFDAAVGPDSDIHYGAGLKIMATDAGVFVRSVILNSPAEKAGFKALDKLLSVNGHPVGVGVRGHLDTDLIKGEAGDVLELEVERAGVPKKLELKIGIVNEPTVTAETVVFGGRRYSVIRFVQFKEKSCNELKKHIQDLPKNISGLILDLRDNPGGLEEEGICVAGLFAGKRDIVGHKNVPIKFPLPTGYRPKLNETIDWLPSYREAAFADQALVILINQNSASAAEIVAGALQDYKLAWLVGDRSFGKGSVQNYEPMRGDRRFYIGYTTALFYRPNGITNQIAGVTPDFDVPLWRTATPAERRAPREGDIHPNSLRPLEAQMQWTQTRPEAEVLRRCVESTAADLTANEMIKKKTGSEDYQKAYALGVFDCSLGSIAQHNSFSARKKLANKK